MGARTHWGRVATILIDRDGKPVRYLYIPIQAARAVAGRR